ncbi:uncharacterized protein LOC108100822 [Drosophila ficusphila]|uniref:uncharacterized protein LOC108100822 n=1 Tax=Drosophila ficusphila TaxID=30025 RepID=UPI001C8911E0|nr:uncharacterized protein LOC108100822 [Drosophila ficusphila]
MILLKAFLLLIAVQASTTSLSTPQSYENFSVFRVYIKNHSDQQVVDQLLEQHVIYNLWHRSITEVHIMVSPRARDNFLAVMRKENIVVEVMIENVQALIDKQSGKILSIAGTDLKNADITRTLF